MKLDFITENEYNTYMEKQTNVSIQMSSSLQKMLEIKGWKNHYIGLYDNENLVATAILNGKKLKFGGMYYICQYGPYIDFDNEIYVKQFFSLIPTLLKKLKTTKFEFNPNLIWKKRASNGDVIVENDYNTLKKLEELNYRKHSDNKPTNGKWDMRFHFVKDISDLSSADLMASYGSQAKRSIKKAKNSGVFIEELTYDQTAEMHKLFEMSANKHGFATRDSGYYKRASDNLQDNVKFLVAKIKVSSFISQKNTEITKYEQQINDLVGTKKDKQINDLKNKLNASKKELEIIENSSDISNDEITLSAGVFILNKQELIYLFGGNNSKYQKFCSSFALQNYVMEYATKNDFDIYNMYGIDGVFDGSDSVLKFKSAFNGYVNEYVGTYELILKPNKLKFSQILKKIFRR